MSKSLSIIVVFLFQLTLNCLSDGNAGRSIEEQISDCEISKRARFLDSLPSISDFESQYRNIEAPTDRMKLQYWDFLLHSLSIEKSYDRKDLAEIGKHLGETIDKADLTRPEKCRALVLGIFFSTSREQELFFLERLKAIDPDNSFVTVVELKDSILFGSVAKTQDAIFRFKEQKRFDLYVQQGYTNHYELWTAFFGEDLRSLYGLRMRQHGGIIGRKLWEYATIFYMYDMQYKYRDTKQIWEGVSLLDYFSLDQLFLHKVKTSHDDFGWYADIANMQLTFFYRLYHDATLYYASGINVPRRTRLFVDRSEKLKADQQQWLSQRDQLRDILFEQRKEIYELVKANILTDLKLEEHRESDQRVRYLKLHLAGRDSDILDNLNAYNSEQPDNLITTRLSPLFEKEKEFWRMIIEGEHTGHEEKEPEREPEQFELLFK